MFFRCCWCRSPSSHRNFVLRSICSRMAVNQMRMVRTATDTPMDELIARKPTKQIGKYVTKKVLLVFFFFFFVHSIHSIRIEDVLLCALVYLFFFFSLHFISFSSYTCMHAYTYANYKLMRCVKIKQENCAQKRHQNKDDNDRDRDGETLTENWAK